MLESKTLNYYDEKTQEFIESTVNVDFKESIFLSLLPMRSMWRQERLTFRSM